MKISEYENCMTFLDNDSEIVLYQTLCVCKESKVSKHVQKYMFLWSQFKVRVFKIKSKEDFHILEINSYKVSKSYDKIMVAIFYTTIVLSEEGVRREELDDKDNALESALKWSVSKVTSALTLGQPMPFQKKIFLMDFDKRNNSLHKEPFLIID